MSSSIESFSNRSSSSSTLVITNYAGWQLRVSKIGKIFFATLQDHVDLEVTQPIIFIGQSSKEHLSSGRRVWSEVEKLFSSKGEKFGFSVEKKDEKYIVIFGSYGLLGGGKKRGMALGAGLAILGGAVILKGKSPSMGAVILGIGNSIAQYAHTTEEKDYSDKEALKEGMIGGLASSIGHMAGSGVNYIVEKVGGASFVGGLFQRSVKQIVATASSIFTQTRVREKRNPQLKEITVGVLAGSVGGLMEGGTSHLMGSSFGSVGRSSIVGALSSGVGSVGSNTVSNYFRGRSLEENFSFSLISGMYTGAIYGARAELDRKEAASQEEKACLQEEKAFLEEWEQDLKEKEKVVANKQQAIYQAMENLFGKQIDHLLEQGYHLADQRIDGKRALILEQIATGHKLTFKKGRHTYSLQTQEIKREYLEAISSQKEALKERECLQRAKEDYENKLQGKVSEDKEVDPVEKREEELLGIEKLKEVDQGLRARIEDLQSRGYTLEDQSLNGNIDEILKQVASGHKLAFMKGKKVRYVEFRPSLSKNPPLTRKSVPKDSLLEAARLMDSAYADYPEKYMEKYLPSFSKVRSDKVGNWKIILVKNNKTGEYSVVFHGVRNISTTVGAFVDHLSDPKKLLKRIGKVLNEWQKNEMKGANISNFYGHSHGGYLANHVKKSWGGVRRVTINAHKGERGSNHINLRSTKDRVSKTPVSIKDRYETVVSGGHGIKNFIEKIEKDHLQWEDILPK